MRQSMSLKFFSLALALWRQSYNEALSPFKFDLQVCKFSKMLVVRVLLAKRIFKFLEERDEI